MNELNKTIFISIAAYNEKYLKQTIESAQKMAEHPERVFFGINYQSTDGCFEDISSLMNIRVRHSIVKEPSGWGIDRLIADSFWKNEDYYLQIDAHMLFEKNWDSGLISAHNKIIEKGFERPIISTFVPWWSVDENGEILRYEPDSVNCCNVCSYTFGSPEKYWIEPKRSWNSTVCGEDMVEHNTICGHFFFTSSSWLEEVGHDWKFIFIGDEHLTALRSYTRGYRMFSIGKPFIWHLNKGVVFDKNDWHNNVGNSNLNRNSVRFKKDLIRQREIYMGELFGYSGAPTAESLKEYLDFVDFDPVTFYHGMDSIEQQKT
jgi:hypothetical protein